jgi:hypothetical protein
VLDVFTLSVVRPSWKGTSLFFRKSVLQGKKLWSFDVYFILQVIILEFSSSIGVDFDHLKVLIAFLEVFCNFDVIFMLVSFLKVLKEFKEDRVTHLKPSFLCLFKQTAVLILQFFTLQSSPIQIHLLLIAKMRSPLLLEVLLDCRRHRHRLVINLIVMLPVPVDLL